jgi:hypothetical protein
MEAATQGRQWMRIYDNESWHLRGASALDDAGLRVVATMCGLKPRHYDLRNERPGNEASCENCLRILTKD